jgi:hypothetical protein
MKVLFQSVFSKKRAKKLSNGSLLCNVYMDVIKNKVVKIRFLTYYEEDLPIKLSELDELEKTIKAHPELFHFVPVIDKIVYGLGGQSVTLPLKFKTLYDED